MSNTTTSWRDELKDWIKNQHGTAGWEQKLENFISQVEQEAYERGVEEAKNSFYGKSDSNSREKLLYYLRKNAGIPTEQEQL